MSQRLELLALARQPDADRAELARRYGVSRKTLYKWLARHAAGLSLADRSRRPVASPTRTDASLEAAVLAVRDAHPAWGPRKIAVVLRRTHDRVPAVSTIGRILLRHDRVDAAASDAATPYTRFEHPRPNDLWQMDFKGDLPLAGGGGRLYPLTVLDDHSRYNLLLGACADQRRSTVLERLRRVFARYGLPTRMLMDNGAPWGVSHATAACYTRIEVELMSLDIAVSHGRPYHPQTQGKEERFHRTLKVELLQHRQLRDLDEAQACFDPWRQTYNHVRPHEALAMATPASRYRMSERRLPATIAPPEYDAGDVVRSLNPVGQLSLGGRTYKLSEAFAGRRVALRPTATDGVHDVYFSRFAIAKLDTRDASVRLVRT